MSFSSINQMEVGFFGRGTMGIGEQLLRTKLLNEANSPVDSEIMESLERRNLNQTPLSEPPIEKLERQMNGKGRNIDFFA